MTVSNFTFTDDCRPVCEIALGPYSGESPTWQDVSCYVHECELTRERERFTDRFNPGTASITFDNRDGWADLAGSPSNIAALPMRPGREIRVGIEGPWDLSTPAVPQKVIRWLWRGFIDKVKPAYDPVLHDIVTAECIDALGEAGTVRIAEQANYVGADEATSTRIGRVLDAAEWSATKRDIEVSTTQLVATKLGDATIDLLGRSADSAGGVIYGNPNDGHVVFKDRDWMAWSMDDPPDFIIGNVDGDGEPLTHGYIDGKATGGFVFARRRPTAAMQVTSDRVFLLNLRKNSHFAYGKLFMSRRVTPLQDLYLCDLSPTTGLRLFLTRQGTVSGYDIQMIPILTRAQWEQIPLDTDFWLAIELDVSSPAYTTPTPYLSPTVGTVSTPDFGALPTQYTLRWKCRGPAAITGTGQIQTPAIAGQVSPFAWSLYRANGTPDQPQTQNEILLQANTNDIAKAVLPTTMGSDEYGRLDVQMLATPTRRAILKPSWSSDGVTWTEGVTTTTPMTFAPTDNTSVVQIGNASFNGRIYWVEMLNASGQVIWRFDANEYPGTGTSYTDPRGRTWTLANAAAIVKNVPAGVTATTKISYDNVRSQFALTSAPPTWQTIESYTAPGAAYTSPVPPTDGWVYVGSNAGDIFDGRIYYAAAHRRSSAEGIDAHEYVNVDWIYDGDFWPPWARMTFDYLNNDFTGNGVDDEWVPDEFSSLNNTGKLRVVDGDHQVIRAQPLTTDARYGIVSPSFLGIGSNVRCRLEVLMRTFVQMNLVAGIRIHIVYYDSANTELPPSNLDKLDIYTNTPGTAPEVFTVTSTPPSNAASYKIRIGVIGGTQAPVQNASAEAHVYQVAFYTQPAQNVLMPLSVPWDSWATEAWTPAMQRDVCPSGWENDFDRADLATVVEIGRTMPEFPPMTMTLTGTTTGSPPAGEVRLNNVDQQAASLMWIPMSAAVDSMMSFVKAGTTIRLQDSNDTGNKSRTYMVIGVPSAVAGWQIPITWQDGETAVPLGTVTLMWNVPAELPAMYRDEGAIDVYGVEVFSRTDLLNSFTTLFETLALRWLSIRGQSSVPRIEAVTLNAATGPPSQFTTANFGDTFITSGPGGLVRDLMSSCSPELPSRYRCRLVTHSGRQVFDRMMFATGVRHFISRNEWTLRVNLDVAEWAAQL